MPPTSTSASAPRRPRLAAPSVSALCAVADRPGDGQSARLELPSASHPDARILVIDDNQVEVRLLSRILKRAGYRRVSGRTDPDQALDELEVLAPDLVVLDFHMPSISGLEVLRCISSRLGADEYLPVLVITGDHSPEVKRRALAAGACDFLSKPFDPAEVLLRIGNLIETRSLQTELCRRVAERTQELEETRDIALMSLAKLADSRDPETGGHLERIAEYSRLLAESLWDRRPDLGIDGAFVEQIHRSSPLHDIGKVGVPDAVLRKPGPLTAAEWRIMRRHSRIGGDTLSQAIRARPGHSFLKMAADIAYQHHERWDGRGYPSGLAGETISLAARIVALADAYDAITSDRPYETSRGHLEAMRRITCDRGSHFDPAVVDAFLAVEDGFDRVRNRYQRGIDG